MTEEKLSITKVITGAVVSNKKDHIKAGVSLVRSVLKQNFAENFKKTLKYYEKKSMLNTEVETSSDSIKKITYLVQAIENKDIISDEVLSSLRRAFTNMLINRSNRPDSSSPSDAKEIEILSAIIDLEPGELRLLNAIYQFATGQKTIPKNSAGDNSSSRNEWLKNMSEASEMGSIAAISKHEESLEGKHLINHPHYNDRSGVSRTDGNDRLTDLGLLVCQYMTLEDDPVAS